MLNQFADIIAKVAPCAGAWIETISHCGKIHFNAVAPCAGAWIETCPALRSIGLCTVAPCAGAWIETIGGWA